MKQVKQQEIAKKLNLSKATVSRCFTNHPGINPQTRALVFETATELGYHHLSNRTNKNEIEQKIFGVLICTTEEEYNRTDYVNSGRNIIKGISEYSQLKNIQLNIHFLDPSITSISSDNFKTLLNTYGKLWDGIIMVHPLPKEIVDFLILRYPCVSTVEQRSSVNMNCIDVDHYQGINYLINFLHEYGHRRIAFYSIEYKFLQSWVLRRAGAYFEKMTKLGLEIKEEDMINVHPKNMVSIEESFNQAAAAIEDGVTAFVCAADHQAYELIKGLEKRGIRVPEDVSICGFDGVQITNNPQQLCTVKIPNYDIGYFATERPI
jgi:DNA-binding LacI/PurR family transcriptional regulator